MTFLFTEDDVVELRRLGWFETAVPHPKFNERMTEDEWLLSKLNNLDEKYVSCQDRVDEVNFLKQARQTATDFHRLRKALDTFNNNNYDQVVLDAYLDDLPKAKDLIAKLCDRAKEYSKALKGKHEPKEDAGKNAAKQVIELWSATSGEPPTRGKGARYNDGNKVHPAGKCFHYVLDKLTQAHEGSINENQLRELLKQARKKHNAKSGI
jgi:hypothetical protein